MYDLLNHFKNVAFLCTNILTEHGATTDSHHVDETRFAQQIGQLKAASQTVSFSEAYKEEQRRILHQFKATLAAMPDFRSVLRNWPFMEQRQRIVFLARCLSHLARIQSEAGFPVRPAPLAWARLKPVTVRGYTNSHVHDRTGEKDLIRYNIEPDVGDIGEALNTIAHEQTHIFHTWLARAVYYGHIGKDHPLYADGEAVLAQQHVDAYIPNSILSAYREQFTEVDSWGMGDAVKAFVEDTQRQMRQSQALKAFGLAAAGIIAAVFLSPRAVPKPAP